MKATNGFLVLVAVAIGLQTVRAAAEDWPQWRGPNRDGKATGFKAPEKWPASLQQKWKVTIGQADATPALVGDKLYVFARQGSDEVLSCLEAETGKQLWSEKTPGASVGGPAREHAGPRSSPAVLDGKVVTLGVGGALICRVAATGKELWRNEEFSGKVPQFSTSSSPVLVDGLCIAQLGGKGAGTVVALDLVSGAKKWSAPGDGPAYASPVLMTVESTKQVVCQTEKSVVGLAVADGKQLWKVAAEIAGRAQNAVTPIIDGSTVIYSGQGNGTRAVAIAKDGDGFTAKELWKNEDVGTGFNTPVLKDGMLYGMSDQSKLFCMDAKTGKAVWTDAAKRGRFAAIVDVGSALLALPDSSELIAFQPGSAYAELAKIKVADGATYAHPVVAGNRIYVKSGDSIVLFTLD